AATRVRSLTPALLTVLVVAGALYALFLRQPGGKLAVHDAEALRTFADFYFTVPALLAALLGFALAARQNFWRAPALFLTVAVFPFTFFYKTRIVPEHFWMARRFLAVILPGALLFASYAAFAGSRSGPRTARLIRGVIGVSFLALVALSYTRASEPI